MRDNVLTFEAIKKNSYSSRLFVFRQGPNLVQEAPYPSRIMAQEAPEADAVWTVDRLLVAILARVLYVHCAQVFVPVLHN